jgi:hypothetical protein
MIPSRYPFLTERWGFNMNSPLRVLHIEDSEDDFRIIGNLLQQGGMNCETIRVATRPELFGALENLASMSSFRTLVCLASAGSKLWR